MTVTPSTIITALKTSPAWVRVGLTAPRAEMRYDAFKALGEHVYHTLFQPLDTDRDQLNLPL